MATAAFLRFPIQKTSWLHHGPMLRPSHIFAGQQKQCLACVPIHGPLRCWCRPSPKFLFLSFSSHTMSYSIHLWSLLGEPKKRCKMYVVLTRSLINGQKYTACLPLIYVLSIQYITSSCIFKWQESGMGKNDRFYSCMPGARFTKYITIYSKIKFSCTRTTYDSDLPRGKISLSNILSWF